MGYAVAEWNSHGQYQYYFNNNRVYWDQGLAFCRSQKPTAFLARPITENAEFLKGFGSAEMYWADHSYDSQGWAWSDGSPLPAGDIHWYSGYPHLPASQGPGWLDVVTGDGSCYYLSSSDPEAGNFTWDGAAQACADQQASLASHGYWTEAMSACHQEEADLLSIHDDMLITFLVLRVGNNTFWTGLQNQNTTYVWQDGSSTDDIDLVEPYLDPWQSGKDCVAMNTELYIPKQQFLIHDDCFAENRFVCQKPAN
ncbi:Accessory gland protein Acp29AB [Amphibalanus amphitrite]|uniref:Accessory gland protein Acp29AB n=1 Tax=Amphibalanus amphitrite TaxID=1232801 RepID=A0A6A4VSF7_AMPAM|nr:Accessory gland protein Acp29AB [Amphibalanus amphitrite]